MRRVKDASARKATDEGMVPPHGASANEPDAPADAANDGAATGGQCPVMLGHIGAMNDVCADFTALTDATRRRSLGRMVARFRKPLSDLVTVTRSPKYAAAFALLADEDAPPFDPDAILADLARVERLEEVAVQLERLTLRVRDEILHTGAAAMKPGLAAIELAQVFAKNNEGFRAKVAHALNDLAAMTAAARRAKSEGAAEGEETEGSTPDEG
jgi:hypothetical protein